MTQNYEDLQITMTVSAKEVMRMREMWCLRHPRRRKSSCWWSKDLLTFFTPSSSSNAPYTNKCMEFSRHSGVFSQWKGTSLVWGKDTHSVGHPSEIKEVFARKNGWWQWVPRGVYKHGESDQGKKLWSHFPHGGHIGAIAGNGNETKTSSVNNIHDTRRRTQGDGTGWPG